MTDDRAREAHRSACVALPRSSRRCGQTPHRSASGSPTRARRVERLAQRYSESALRQVAESADEAEQLLTFAEHSADVSARRREAVSREEANLALETVDRGGASCSGAPRRGRGLRDRGAARRVDARRRHRGLPRRPRRRPSRAAGPRGDRRRHRARSGARRPARLRGVKADPFAELSRLREANTGLDAAIAVARERAARPIPSVAHVRHAHRRCRPAARRRPQRDRRAPRAGSAPMHAPASPRPSAPASTSPTAAA